MVSTTEYTSFDILGRVLGAKQTTAGGDPLGYTTGYTYNLSGALIEETYPSGRKVKNVLDNDGELSLVQSARCGVVNGVTATCSDPQGYFSYAKSFFCRRQAASEILFVSHDPRSEDRGNSKRLSRNRA